MSKYKWYLVGGALLLLYWVYSKRKGYSMNPTGNDYLAPGTIINGTLVTQSDAELYASLGIPGGYVADRIRGGTSR